MRKPAERVENPEELAEELSQVFGRIRRLPEFAAVNATGTEIGSVIYAVRPGTAPRGAGRQLPAGFGRPGQYLPGVRYQALPLQCDQLGHAALPDGGGAGV